MLVPLALAAIASGVASGIAWGAHRFSRAGRALRATRRAAKDLSRAGKRVRAELSALGRDVELRADTYCKEAFRERLEELPLETLRRRGVSGVRWSALEDAGVRTLADLEGRTQRSLEAIKGVGATTASEVLTAGAGLRLELSREPIPAPGPDDVASPAAGALLGAARRLLEGRDVLQPAEQRLEAASGRAAVAKQEARRQAGFLTWLRRGTSEEGLASTEREATALRELLAAEDRSGVLAPERGPWRRELPPADLARDVEARYADYVSVLERVLGGAGAEDVARPSGVPRGLAAEVAQRILAHPLDARGLRLSLRRYQEFGARYVLAQRRTLLGDEMGLGKTVQALAAMAHLESESPGSHFLVVCPASIVGNWGREISQRTDFGLHLVHGDEKREAAAAWLEQGGVAVTSYATLRDSGLAELLAAGGLLVRLLVVDEAHYAKNPEAGRSVAVRSVAERSERVCLMSGTPLENKLEEFSNLLELVSPEVSRDVRRALTGTQSFVQLVAPVYLRRNQEDVLRELPERIDKEEWVDLTPADRAAYHQAVREGNYMAMRVAATLGGRAGESAKLERLADLIEEYREQGRKVLVFSYFLDVLHSVAREVPAVGVLQGSVSPSERLELVDRFSAAEGHAVLLAQIIAGGVGLNIQAASAVVLLEPQWKPSTEEQAIARAHRMGQTRVVVVHKLLARATVDERLLAALEEKQRVFDESARPSELKEAAPEATEAGFARSLVAAEQAALGAG